MPIAASDILVHLSVNTSPGLSTAQANVNNSLGGYISSTQITAASLNNLYDDISGTENAASTVDYRLLFFRNAHASLTAQNVRVYMTSETAGGASAAISVDTTGVTPQAQAGTLQSKTIANETTAPATQTFSTTAIDYASGLTIANIPALNVVGIWVKRTAANSAALNLDSVVVQIGLDTTQ